MSVLALLLATLAFACLALAMERHHRDVAGYPPAAARRRLLRLLGCGSLAASLAASIGAWGIAWGVVGWCGVLAAAAGAMVLWLSFRHPAMPAPRPSSRS
ncbi:MULTISPECIES: DUF3325 domain-containing protein [unclassified Stenotrophomonas]|uniref:DUF3325 domain-containing protein n=1 Tax=unclassified Stenotrophomonas TaxID=196198 RepID=UPI0005AED932|nr:DUF3325 domain-containing protein [Stenotrophomonas sp. CFBP8980]KIP87205.1 hypothetical protein SN15_03485 [Stenotrophomonas maltophilia]MBD8642490.1 DUF3325 domain-containing protein [Stenotrophomonas sp. CFBP 13724]MDY1033040.1 DUF3325 domain-containing protein [Stenotrophomonas sp. CFBP8980]